MYWIVGQIKKRNMPMELVLLPIVESAFDPHATSSANAAGLWQIVPQTGRNYGLKTISGMTVDAMSSPRQPLRLT